GTYSRTLRGRLLLLPPPPPPPSPPPPPPPPPAWETSWESDRAAPPPSFSSSERRLRMWPPGPDWDGAAGPGGGPAEGSSAFVAAPGTFTATRLSSEVLLVPGGSCAA